MSKSITGISLIICLGILVVGCSSLPAAGKSATAVVNMAEPVESSLEKEIVEIRNCDNKSEHHPLTEKAPVACQATIASQASPGGEGEPLTLTTELKTLLADQVQAAYQQTCDAAKAGTEQADLYVPMGKIKTWTINWTRQTFNSTVSFAQDELTYSAVYTYTLDTPTAAIIMETGCTA